MKIFEKRFNSNLVLPMNDKGEPYSVDCLYPDQAQVVARVVAKIKEFVECKDPANFKPMRLTINGPGGSGKSVIINTIVSTLRQMFDCNDVVRVCAPTGAAAFNVGGETMHSLCKNAVSRFEYKPNSMQDSKRKALVAKFRTLMCLIVDERSLASNKELGRAERQIAETIFGGGPIRDDDSLFGGLPVVILVGDDYQLPGAKDECAIHALTSSDGFAMSIRGRAVFRKCGMNVLELVSSKRLHDDRKNDRDLMSRLRLGEVTDEDVSKLLSLHLDAIRKRHGDKTADDIENRAIHLSFTNEKKNRHNLEQLCKDAGPDNPAATLRPQCPGSGPGGKAVNSHFSKDSQVPKACFICAGAKVAIEGRNFCPMWGLHNGACGTVKEIVYDKDHNPNHGNLPKYVVVDFPLYCGPPWDLENPKVTTSPCTRPTVVQSSCIS